MKSSTNIYMHYIRSEKGDWGLGLRDPGFLSFKVQGLAPNVRMKNLERRDGSSVVV